MSVLHYLRYVPAVVFVLLAVICALGATPTQGGVNSNGILIVPAFIFLLLSLAAWAIAYFA